MRLLLPIREKIFKLNIRQDIKRYITVGIKLILDNKHRDITLKIMYLNDVLFINIFSLSLNNLKSLTKLFLNISRFNYLCVLNADPFYNNKSGYKSVFIN